MLSPDQVTCYERDGYLVIERFWDSDVVHELKVASDELLTSFEPPTGGKSVFSTQEQNRTSDEYFLTSGDQVRYFFEPAALDAAGILIKPKEQAVNKIGHALHELIPVFRAYSLECPRVASIIRNSLGFKRPVVPQSMLICKPALIGGAVGAHVDGAFLYTRPQTCVGLWWPLEDCTLENGCLWAVPGSHNRQGGEVARRFKRDGGGGGAPPSNPSIPPLLISPSSLKPLSRYSSLRALLSSCTTTSYTFQTLINRKAHDLHTPYTL